MRTILKSKPRLRMSGGALNQMRRDGFIPASVSERGEKTQHCFVSREQLSNILSRYGASALIELEGTEGSTGNVLVISRDIQRAPVGNAIIHVGFQRLTARDAITAEVRLTLLGQPLEVRNGTAVLEQVINSLLVRAVPDKLPAHIEVDTSDMQVGSVIHLSSLPISGDYELVSPPDTVIAVLQTVRGAIAQETPVETPVSAT